jgi:hypothetical protein
MEVKINEMVARHQNRGGACPDVTGLVGAAIVSCSCGARPRAQASTESTASLLTILDESLHPYLWRLAQARRLFLVVLSVADSPIATSSRQTFQTLQSMQTDSEVMTKDMQALKSDMKSLMKHFKLPTHTE